ncbi:23S rRNA (uracil(1939)-C(5))-methyltransferase RlmD [Conexibacter sp. DBS9H8]|uniref:23S rRNA (uracil(1939)-C(5))-methyltransferase RlmD n=1 Tax=Conexibacter sp. DBS9H8 TaxID=2937801 RepID=UPI0020106958|nr:23S rRNA (uracil(1939)-C(5))-methyltransferase RlmD [Conexibacter sp. DBS9H8]
MEPPRSATRPQRGERLELRIDSLAHGGAGVARSDGYVLFVAGGLPGDRVLAEVTKAKRAYAEARAVEVLEPSPDRVAPVADHPGAPWQVLPYERQLAIKQEQVEDALRRIGRLDGFVIEPIVPALEPWRYRNKLEYSFGDDPTGAPGDGPGRLICGFHAPGRWEEIVEVRDCLLASEASNRAREEVVDFCRARGLAAYDRRRGTGFLRNLVIREGRRSGQLQVRLVTGPTTPGQLDRAELCAATPSADTLLWTRTEALAETTQGGITDLLKGSPKLPEALGGLELAISPEAFFQTNTEMAERLYGLAIEYAQLTGFERVYDLYCGIGTIGLMMAPRAAEVWGLEIIPAAVEDAAAAALANEIDNARFSAGDVRLVLRDLNERAGRPDVLVVDPPRAGLSPKIVRRIIETAPRRIVYVSCNPTTLAPNAAQLVEAGYTLTKVRPVDMFPQTPHVECVAQLERRG